jgi:ribulose 1,5-bisphosphate synthetase/thiazole synthase
MRFSIATLAVLSATASAFTHSSFTGKAFVGPKSTSALDMKYKVAVVGGGPSGACAAEIFAQEKNIDTVMFERKMDNAKPCGGAIPLCMVGEFDMPESVVDRKVRKIFRSLSFACFAFEVIVLILVLFLPIYY